MKAINALASIGQWVIDTAQEVWRNDRALALFGLYALLWCLFIEAVIVIRQAMGTW